MTSVTRRIALAIILSLAGITAATAQKVDRVEGEVRRVNPGDGKVTLRHGPLPNLDMPAMTMVYTAKNPSILNEIKVGDRVEFASTSENGVFYVLEIKKLK